VKLPIFLVDYVLDPRRPGASGLSDIVWDMAEELARQGEEPHVFGPYSDVPRPGIGVQLHPFRVPPPGYRNAVGHVGMVLSAYREIRRLRRPGIVHAPEYVSTAVIASLCRDLPVVLTVPGNIYEKIASKANPYDPTFTAILCLAARISARRCARVVAISSLMTEWWARTGTPSDRLLHLPLGVDVALFRPRAEASGTLLGSSGDRLRILGVGRLNPENDFGTLIRAFAEVRAEFPNVELHLAGDGPELPKLKALANDLAVADRVVWLGWTDRVQLAHLYPTADLFVFSALTGGLPRVMLEAMACGLPVVAMDVPGVADHVVDGVTGYLVARGSSGALARKMVAALSDPTRRAQVARAGMQHVREELAWAAIVRKLVERVYRPLSDSVVAR
jgi:glycosyltransferase involved in cell wall biosynthesis